MQPVITMSRFARLDTLARAATKRGNTTIGAECFAVGSDRFAVEIHTTWKGR